MAWSLLELSTNTSGNSDMANRVRMAFLKSAVDIVQEQPGHPNYSVARNALAQSIIEGEGLPPNVHAVLALRSPDVIQAAAPTDQSIQDAVNGNFDYFAGIQAE